MVTVCRYKTWDIANDVYILQPRMAALDWIEKTDGATHIEGTARDVPDSALDGDGFYDPRLGGKTSPG